jgi:hypothetical protein
MKHRIVNYHTMIDYGVLCDDLHSAVQMIKTLGPEWIAVEEGANQTEACLAAREWDNERDF